MELTISATINKPIQHGLAPYLTDLDINDAIVGFNKFADMIEVKCPLEQQQHQQQQQQQLEEQNQRPWLTVPDDIITTDKVSSGSLWLLASPSPHSSSSSSSSSGANSPAPSDQTTTNSKPGRRFKNATAAKRYRKKVKCCKCGLSHQMECELQRNAQLRRDLEAKLALYREFVELLAFNTSKSDADLAQLGLRSLTNILDSLNKLTCTCHAIDDETRSELEAQKVRFQQIINDSSNVNEQQLQQVSF